LAVLHFMHRILYISYDGMTDPLGQSQVIPYLIGLSKFGYEFHILSAEKPDAYAQHQNEIADLLAQHQIYWHPVEYTKNPPLVSTMRDIRKMKYLANKLHQQYHFSMTHCRSYISAFVGMMLKKTHQVPFLFDMRGFYADERVDGGLWKQSNPVFKAVYKYFKRKERHFFNGCDHLISLTENGKETIDALNFKSLEIDDITVIPCCADLAHFNPERVIDEQIQSFRKKFNLRESDFVLTYLGSIGTWYMPEEMLDFFAELLKSKPQSKFLIITKDNTDLMKAQAEKKQIPQEKIVFTSASRDEVPIFLKLTSISVFFIKPVFSKKASSPTKLAELLAMGVPVVCNGNVGDIDRIVEANKAGLVLHDFNPETYREIINQLPELLQTDPSHLRQVSNELFSLKEGVSRYLKVYQKLIQPK
jgi:glycosyltransferase involved in cell wall biosynthesis